MTSANLTVYYNTRCPVCDVGIDWQRNKLLALVRAGTVEFKDINEQPEALAQFGASLDDIRRRLHATDEAGRLIVGADVAIALWRMTPARGGLRCYQAIASRSRSRGSSTTALPIYCLPGRNGAGAGERLAADSDTSPQRGEVDLLLVVRSIVQSKSGEGVLPNVRPETLTRRYAPTSPKGEVNPAAAQVQANLVEPR